MFWRVSASPHGPPLRFQDRLPGARGLVGVAGAHHRQARDRPQGGHVLDRLVGRPVLAEPDRVVRPDVDDRDLHHRRQPHGAAHVVGEDQERAAVGAGRAVQRDARQDRAHRVLTDAEVQRAAVRRGLPQAGRRARGPNEGWPSIVVLLLSARSAEPPHSSGSTSASAFSTSPEALRVDTPFGSGSQDGSAFSHPKGSWRAVSRSNSSLRSGSRAAHSSNDFCQAGVRLLAALHDLAGVLQHAGRRPRRTARGRTRGSS